MKETKKIKTDYDHMVALAEAQLLGFKHAEEGFDLESLVESMGLSIEEWETIKKEYSIPYLTEKDKEIIEGVLNDQRN